MVIASTWDTERADYRAIVNEWHVVRRSEEVSESAIVPARLLGEDIILWRHDGEVHAWKDYCRHRGARLSLGWVKDGCVVCPYHGWEYGTDGACRRYPAHPTTRPTSRAAAFRHHAVERYGYIWVCMDNPVAAVPPFPVWEDASYRKVQAGPYHYNANALRAVENFLDPAHFPFVHGNLNGNPDDPDELADYDVVLTDEGLRTSEITLFQPYGDHRGIPINAVYRYYCFRPTTAYFNKETGEVERFCTFLAVTPVDLENCVLHLTAAINYGFDVAVEQIVTRMDKVYEQDRVIVESQRPKTLPLHPKDEIHLRSDLLDVEYRRWLRALAGDGSMPDRAQESAVEGAVAAE